HYLRRHIRVTETLEGQRFFVRRPDPNRAGKAVLYATPLFLCLMLVEGADLVFAVDSVPAIFAVTTDIYIVYTSNIFAILGLRALYFALAAAIHRFRYLEKARALILVFIGGKIFLVNVVGKIPPEFPLAVIVSLLAGDIVVSLLKTRGETAAVRRAGSRGAE
ncbi:MAG: TerC family protein, partial [Alphaproteobacteria bacterium]|nr:TerC family protein [Alphaproteobacteria bacterium]